MCFYLCELHTLITSVSLDTCTVHGIVVTKGVAQIGPLIFLVVLSRVTWGLSPPRPTNFIDYLTNTCMFCTDSQGYESWPHPNSFFS